MPDIVLIVITGYLVSGRIVYIVYIFFLLRKKIVQKTSKTLVKIRAHLSWGSEPGKTKIKGISMVLGHFPPWLVPPDTSSLGSSSDTSPPSLWKFNSRTHPISCIPPNNYWTKLHKIRFKFVYETRGTEKYETMGGGGGIRIINTNQINIFVYECIMELVQLSILLTAEVFRTFCHQYYDFS